MRHPPPPPPFPLHQCDLVFYAPVFRACFPSWNFALTHFDLFLFLLEYSLCCLLTQMKMDDGALLCETKPKISQIRTLPSWTERALPAPESNLLSKCTKTSQLQKQNQTAKTWSWTYRQHLWPWLLLIIRSARVDPTPTDMESCGPPAPQPPTQELIISNCSTHQVGTRSSTYLLTYCCVHIDMSFYIKIP